MAYVKTEWEAAPSTNTPINPTNLNHIEQGIYDNSLGVENIGNLSNLETTAKTNLVAAINELKDGEEYSATETLTNKVWIDGKPIYRIVYHLTSISTGQNYFGSTSGIDEYISSYGIVHRTNGNHYFISSFLTTNAFVAVGIDNNTYKKFNLVIGSGVSNITDAYVVIEYTKTT